jgi:hypothetical protein
MIVGTLAVLTPLAACGGSSKSSTSGASSETTVASDSTSGSNSGTSDSEYCAKIKEYKAQSDALDAVMQSTDPKAIRKGFETILVMLHDLDKNPPSAIAADVHAVREVSDEVVSVFDKYDYDFTKLATAPEFEALSKKMDSAAINDSNKKLDAYSTDVCGLPPDSTVPETTVSN